MHQRKREYATRAARRNESVRRALTVAIAVQALCLASCKAGALPALPALTGTEAVLLPDPNTGYILLSVWDAPYVKPGRLFRADDAESLWRLWRNFEIAGQPPSADFAKYIVVLFADLSMDEGGNGWGELRRLLLGADGAIHPEFAVPTLFASDEISHPPVLYVLAVRRDRLPVAAPLELGAAHVVALPDAKAPAEATCVGPPPPYPRPGEDSTLSVPEPGITALAYLSDGTPVFVARHADATLDVFAADTRGYDVLGPPNLPLRGLRDEVVWDCAQRRFLSALGSYDEYGVPIAGARWESLERYAAIDGGPGVAIVRAHARPGPGYPPRPVASPPEVWGGARLAPYAAGAALDLDAAMALPAGSRVRLKANLLLETDGPPRFCDRLRDVPGSGHPRCAGTSVDAVGVTWSGAYPSEINGPFSARVTARGLSDVAAADLPGSEGGNPKRWDDGDGIEIGGFVSSLGAVGSGVAFVGAEGGLDARLRRRRSYTLLRALVGDEIGVSVRARSLIPTSPGDTQLRVGVLPLLSDGDFVRQWFTPSALGLLVPEVGLGFTRGERFPFVAWSLPIDYHFESPRYRRHPYDARDVLGLRLSPQLLVSFRRDGADVLYGLSAGVSAW